MSERRIGVVLSYIYTITQVLVNLIYVRLLLDTIGKSEYGLYQIVASVIAYMKLLQNGLSVGVSRYYCVYKANNNEDAMANTLAIARNIYHKISWVIIFAGFVLVFAIRLFYKSSFTPQELMESQVIFAIMIASTLVDINNTVYVSAISANEKFVFLKIVDILTVIFQPLVVILIVDKFPYATTIVAVQLLFSVIFSLVRRLYATRSLNIAISYSSDGDRLEKKLLYFSGITVLALIADQIFWRTDQIILGKIYGTAVVAVYSVGSQVYTNYMHFSTSISNVFMPRISQLYGDGHDIKPVSDLFIKIGRIQFFVLGIILIAFGLYGVEFVNIWVGKGYFDAYIVALVVMIPFTIDLTQNIGLTILQVANKYEFRAKMYFIISVINIVSTIFMAQLYGGIGAALSTGISMFIGSGLIMNYYYEKKMGLDIHKFWKEIFNILLYDIVVFIVGLLINKIHLQNSITQFAVHVVLLVCFYCFFMYRFAMNTYEKGLVVSSLKKVHLLR